MTDTVLSQGSGPRTHSLPNQQQKKTPMKLLPLLGLLTGSGWVCSPPGWQSGLLLGQGPTTPTPLQGELLSFWAAPPSQSCDQLSCTWPMLVQKVLISKRPGLLSGLLSVLFVTGAWPPVKCYLCPLFSHYPYVFLFLLLSFVFFSRLVGKHLYAGTVVCMYLCSV